MIDVYWQLDPAAEPWRGEPALRPSLPELVRDLRRPTQNRYDFYAQVATAAEQTGFDGLFVAHRRQSDDSRIIAAALAREVPRLRLLAEVPASVGSAVYAAKQATTFQRGAQGRLEWAIAPDADAPTRAAEGDFVADEDLAERKAEFLTVARGVHGTPGFTFKGKHFEVENGGFTDPLTRGAFPLVVLQGSSEEDLEVSARLAHLHLFDTRSSAQLASLIEGLDALANAAGRRVGFGLHQPVLARQTSAEAERDFARSTLPETTLVGSFDEVAESLAQLVSLGLDRLVLSADQQLEGAYALGQHLLPRLRARLSVTPRAAA